MFNTQHARRGNGAVKAVAGAEGRAESAQGGFAPAFSGFGLLCRALQGLVLAEGISHGLTHVHFKSAGSAGTDFPRLAHAGGGVVLGESRGGAQNGEAQGQGDGFADQSGVHLFPHCVLKRSLSALSIHAAVITFKESLGFYRAGGTLTTKRMSLRAALRLAALLRIILEIF